MANGNGRRNEPGILAYNRANTCDRRHCYQQREERVASSAGKSRRWAGFMAWGHVDMVREQWAEPVQAVV